ncbi:hypothetical protein [Asticcacaulis benevestitus]|uniref:Lipoprotein n=1 Tax=Asticcacaulis benevestitus DSM 16100 = ATCC BAA-896 TaxID=1121022 RepID=V4PLS3_9CAUL|nr:hypothetical protein [Asticcacaulis benevestitus]ESQ89171.1 hypothetical protein ABENE_14450 [Asticcacaulis benevestitus DSM 16100 = ATCC BAA-896]
MKKFWIMATCVPLLVTLSACDTTSPMASYSVLPANTLALQGALKSKGATVKVGDVTKAATVSDPHCRLAGALDVTNGKTVEAYVKSALQAELLAAQSYDVAAPTTINARLDQLDVNTVGDAAWTIGLTLTSNVNPTGYQVTSTYKFKTSFSAIAACQNATSAFIPALQEAIGSGVSNAQFATLITQ